MATGPTRVENKTTWYDGSQSVFGESVYVVRITRRRELALKKKLFTKIKINMDFV